MKTQQQIPINQMIATVKSLGFRFFNAKQEDDFMSTRCQIQQTEFNNRPVYVLYVDRVKVGMYNR